MMRGYRADPKDLPKSPTGYVFDPKTLNWRVGSLDLDFAKTTPLGERRFRFEVGHPVAHEARIGDFMAFRGDVHTDVSLEGCARCVVEGVTFESSTGFVVHEGGGPGGNVYRYTVRRGPTPPGASVPPLLAANADAFHSSGMRKGPRLEGCAFANTPDDGVPIHGNYVGVAVADGKRLVVTTIWGGEWFRPGDRLRLYAKGGAALKGEAKVVSAREISGEGLPELSYGPLKGDRRTPSSSSTAISAPPWTTSRRTPTLGATASSCAAARSGTTARGGCSSPRATDWSRTTPWTGAPSAASSCAPSCTGCSPTSRAAWSSEATRSATWATRRSAPGVIRWAASSSPPRSQGAGSTATSRSRATRSRGSTAPASWSATPRT